eukprot:GCRY01002632.1.p1 GENE.GCRY01002632.1~~GCRY01002632.1.p1  ORF type:complete len:556 (+),score=63.38 GCRY01002632.1:193-1860(+)
MMSATFFSGVCGTFFLFFVCLMFSLAHPIVQTHFSYTRDVFPYADYNHRGRRAAFSLDVELFPSSNDSSTLSLSPEVDIFVDDVKSHTLKVQGHQVFVANPLAVTDVITPAQGCGTASTVRESLCASSLKCVFGMNAGFFNTTTNECLGNLVVNSSFVQSSGNRNANFGMLNNGSFITGYIPPSVATSLNFKYLVSGVVWLVRNGNNYVSTAAKEENLDTQETGSNFIDIVSARTAIGHDSEGNLGVVVIDGQSYQRGIDLTSFATLLIDHGFVNAINLDGGGSATAVVNGTVVNYVSDHCGSDPAFRCERKVTTAFCVHEPLCAECGHGKCIWGVCECEHGYTGDHCNVTVDTCAASFEPLCGPNAQCITQSPSNTSFSLPYLCLCSQGYYGNPFSAEGCSAIPHVDDTSSTCEVDESPQHILVYITLVSLVGFILSSALVICLIFRSKTNSARFSFRYRPMMEEADPGPPAHISLLSSLPQTYSPSPSPSHPPIFPHSEEQRCALPSPPVEANPAHASASPDFYPILSAPPEIKTDVHEMSFGEDSQYSGDGC